MKAFALSVLFVVVLAIAGWFLLEGTFARSSDAAFSMPSARVGEGGSVERRDWVNPSGGR